MLQEGACSFIFTSLIKQEQSVNRIWIIQTKHKEQAKIPIINQPKPANQSNPLVEIPSESQTPQLPKPSSSQTRTSKASQSMSISP